MRDQGYDLNTIIKEDNRSTMLLMKDGRLSSGKRTKHLDIRYFNMQDLINRGIVEIEHCNTEDMIAVFFTKPLQGKRFQILRDIILNRKEVSVSHYRSVLGNIMESTIVETEKPKKDLV
jgi:hypothetical protein